MSWLVFIIFNALMTSVLAITKCQATEKPRIPKDRLRVLIGCPKKFKKRRLNSSYGYEGQRQRPQTSFNDNSPLACTSQVFVTML